MQFIQVRGFQTQKDISVKMVVLLTVWAVIILMDLLLDKII